MKSAGEAYVTAVESFNSQNPGLTGTYMDSKSAKAEKRARVNLLDLKEQGVGEAHVFFKSRIIRANLFFMDPGPAQAMRLNVMLKVEIPKDTVLYTLVKSIEDFEAMIQSTGLPQLSTEDDEDINSIVERTVEQSRVLESIDRGINVLFELHKHMIQQSTASIPRESEGDVATKVEDKAQALDAEIIQEGVLQERSEAEMVAQVTIKEYCINIMTRIQITGEMRSVIGVDEDCDYYGLPLIQEQNLETAVLYILRIFGHNKKNANKELKNLIQIVQDKTVYGNLAVVSVSEITARIEKMITVF